MNITKHIYYKTLKRQKLAFEMTFTFDLPFSTPHITGMYVENSE